jgi:hypothetical protein
MFDQKLQMHSWLYYIGHVNKRGELSNKVSTFIKVGRVGRIPNLCPQDYYYHHAPLWQPTSRCFRIAVSCNPTAMLVCKDNILALLVKIATMQTYVIIRSTVDRLTEQSTR